MGAWIEIDGWTDRNLPQKSLPSWERGLKFFIRFFRSDDMVAPFMGAWIEMFLLYEDEGMTGGRSLHGSVD